MLWTWSNRQQGEAKQSETTERMWALAAFLEQSFFSMTWTHFPALRYDFWPTREVVFVDDTLIQRWPSAHDRGFVFLHLSLSQSRRRRHCRTALSRQARRTVTTSAVRSISRHRIPVSSVRSTIAQWPHPPYNGVFARLCVTSTNVLGDSWKCPGNIRKQLGCATVSIGGTFGSIQPVCAFHLIINYMYFLIACTPCLD